MPFWQPRVSAAEVLGSSRSSSVMAGVR
jgi:hypothetical protein